jgi:hypothetical protein
MRITSLELTLEAVQFNKVSTRQIMGAGKKASSVEKAISQFTSTSSGNALLLLRGNYVGIVPSSFKNVPADAVIYWGLPSDAFCKLMSSNLFPTYPRPSYCLADQIA